MAAKRFCQSCGDPLLAPSEPVPAQNVSPDMVKALVEKCHTHCLECAKELVLGRLPRTTLNHDTGGGRRVIRDPRGLQ